MTTPNVDKPDVVKVETPEQKTVQIQLTFFVNNDDEAFTVKRLIDEAIFDYPQIQEQFFIQQGRRPNPMMRR